MLKVFTNGRHQFVNLIGVQRRKVIRLFGVFHVATIP